MTERAEPAASLSKATVSRFFQKTPKGTQKTAVTGGKEERKT